MINEIENSVPYNSTWIFGKKLHPRVINALIYETVRFERCFLFFNQWGDSLVHAKASLNDPVTTREQTTRGENAIEVAYGLAEAGQYLHSSTDKERQDILNVTESLYTGSKQLFAIETFGLLSFSN